MMQKNQSGSDAEKDYVKAFEFFDKKLKKLFNRNESGYITTNEFKHLMGHLGE